MTSVAALGCGPGTLAQCHAQWPADKHRAAVSWVTVLESCCHAGLLGGTSGRRVVVPLPGLPFTRSAPIACLLICSGELCRLLRFPPQCSCHLRGIPCAPPPSEATQWPEMNPPLTAAPAAISGRPAAHDGRYWRASAATATRPDPATGGHSVTAAGSGPVRPPSSLRPRPRPRLSPRPRPHPAPSPVLSPRMHRKRRRSQEEPADAADDHKKNRRTLQSGVSGCHELSVWLCKPRVCDIARHMSCKERT